MGEDRIKAAAERVRSTIKRAIGRLAGGTEARPPEGSAGEVATEAGNTRHERAGRTARDTAKD